MFKTFLIEEEQKQDEYFNNIIDNCSDIIRFYESAQWSEPKLLKRYSSSSETFKDYDKRRRKYRLGSKRLGNIFDLQIIDKLDPDIPKRIDSYFFMQLREKTGHKFPDRSKIFGENCHIIFPYDGVKIATMEKDFNLGYNDLEYTSLYAPEIQFFDKVLDMRPSGIPELYETIKELLSYLTTGIEPTKFDRLTSGLIYQAFELRHAYDNEINWDVDLSFSVAVKLYLELQDYPSEFNPNIKNIVFTQDEKDRLLNPERTIFDRLVGFYDDRVKLIDTSMLNSNFSGDEFWTDGKSIGVKSTALPDFIKFLKK